MQQGNDSKQLNHYFVIKSRAMRETVLIKLQLSLGKMAGSAPTCRFQGCIKVVRSILIFIHSHFPVAFSVLLQWTCCQFLLFRDQLMRKYVYFYLYQNTHNRHACLSHQQILKNLLSSHLAFCSKNKEFGSTLKTEIMKSSMARDVMFSLPYCVGCDEH